MFSLGVGDYFFPMISFNFTFLVTANFLGLNLLNSPNFFFLLVANCLTLPSVYYTHLSKEKASYLSLNRDLHGIPLIPFLFLASCFFISLFVFFDQVDELFASFLFLINIFAYFFFTVSCFYNFKKFSHFIKCPICTRLLSTNYNYCDRCGEPLNKKSKKEEKKTAKKQIIEQPQFKGICPKCKGKLFIGSIFCPHCGYSLPEDN